MSILRFSPLFAMSTVLLACDPTPGPADAGAEDAGPSTTDAGRDAGVPPDGGPADPVAFGAPGALVGAAGRGSFRFGVATARRGWLEAEDVINTWAYDRLMEWLREGNGPPRH